MPVSGKRNNVTDTTENEPLTDISNLEYNAAIDRRSVMDRPTVAEDITNIKGVDRQYHAGTRETTYTFECDVRGVHDILTYELSQHDDGEGFTIHTENNDIWESMSEPELRKLETILSREAIYFLWQHDIENAATVKDLQDVRYSFMYAENLNLSQAQKERLYDAITIKEKEIQGRGGKKMKSGNEVYRSFEGKLDVDHPSGYIITELKDFYEVEFLSIESNNPAKFRIGKEFLSQEDFQDEQKLLGLMADVENGCILNGQAYYKERWYSGETISRIQNQKQDYNWRKYAASYSRQAAPKERKPAGPKL